MKVLECCRPSAAQIWTHNVKNKFLNKGCVELNNTFEDRVDRADISSNHFSANTFKDLFSKHQLDNKNPFYCENLSPGKTFVRSIPHVNRNLHEHYKWKHGNSVRQIVCPACSVRLHVKVDSVVPSHHCGSIYS